MSTVIYNYRVIDPSTEKYVDINKTPLDILVNVEVKLVVIDNNYEGDGGVIDSSSTFFNRTLKLGTGLKTPGDRFEFEEPPIFVDGTKSDSVQLRVNLGGRSMDASDTFKSFWAKWSEKCGEKGYDAKATDNGALVNGPYFGLQIIQTFKGDATFAGFSHTDYLFVPFFVNKGNECNRKNCVDPSFDFYDTTSDDIDVKLLQFNTELVVTKQIRVAEQKIDFEISLQNYQAQLIAQSAELILSTYDYEPDSFTKVITRLLEFQQGTLITALDFTRNADLTQLYNLLGPTNGIQNEIESLAGLYPSITIEDGEGIPYGDGIPGIYSFFGWGFKGDDLFSVVNKDETSRSNYGIITRNNVQIFDTRSEFGSLYGREYFVPADYISWGSDAGWSYGDIIECTITVTDYVGETINFVKSNYGFELDSVSSGVTIARGVESGIYNSLVESEWDNSISPSGTTWNSEYNAGGGNFGWNNLPTVSSRTFGTFYSALDDNPNDNIIGLELVMRDLTTNQYWAIKFTDWVPSDKGGGFEYERRLINPTGTVRTFKDTLVWKK
jgi:hypothetical protein